MSRDVGTPARLCSTLFTVVMDEDLGLAAGPIRQRTSNLLAACALSVGIGALSSGCPPAGRVPSPGPAPRSSRREAPPARPPGLGQGPYGIVIETAAGGAAIEVAQTLHRDLELSGIFVPLRGARFRQQLASGRSLPHRAGPLPHVTTRVELRVEATRAAIVVDAQVSFDTTSAGRPAGALSAAGRDAREAAHRLGNELYRLHTARPGPFLSQIAFVGPAAGQPGSRHVFVTDFAGSAPLRVPSDGGPNILPAWSPEGDLIFTSFARGNPDLFIFPRRARRSRALSTRPGLNTGGSFAPDGRLIAITLTQHGNQDIYLIDRRGAVRRRLTQHPKIDVSPTWSPDGGAIAFVSERSGVPQIYVLELGGAPRRLTRGGADNQEPDWCALEGSTLIAYTSRRGGAYQIFVVDAATGLSRQLTFDGRENTSPSWSPDCQLLVYSDGQEGLRTITADGQRRWQLYRGIARSPAWSGASSLSGSRTPRRIQPLGARFRRAIRASNERTGRDEREPHAARLCGDVVELFRAEEARDR